MRKLILILLTLTLFMACKSTKNKQDSSYSSSFEKKEYELLNIEGKDVSDMNLALRIEPDGNRISGESGCNNYQFIYELEGENLNLGYGVATKMYCEETMDIENAFFAASKKVKHFKQSDEMIHFLDENGKELINAKVHNPKEKK